MIVVQLYEMDTIASIELSPQIPVDFVDCEPRVSLLSGDKELIELTVLLKIGRSVGKVAAN